MNKIRNQIRFLLNDNLIQLDTVAATTSLLDYLRLERRLYGTKEGCAEGDCGACTILVGRISAGELIYETVNSCIRFLGSLDGCHVVTIEHLKKKDGSLHPVQQAMVENHGSQCGFCTPGIVMSLYALWMANPAPNNQEIEKALQGNLCRCTGYEPIIKAAQAISSIDSAEHDPLIVERKQVMERLQSLHDHSRVEIKLENSHFFLPASLQDLADIRQTYPNSTIVAGSTDVGLWVTKHMQDISPIVFISHLEELHKIEIGSDGIKIGASVTYNELSPLIEKYFPHVSPYWNRIGGEQVRNMGTIGGNLANGSPIGDTPPMLIALGATMTLRCGSDQKTLAVEDFFIDYGKQDRSEGDFVESVYIPFVKDGSLFATYKISKRRDEDISAVSAAFCLHLEDGIIQEAILAYGGMAARPKRTSHVEKKLVGKPWSAASLVQALAVFAEDFSPLSDWRASAEYRSLVAQNLLKRFLLETKQPSKTISLDRDAILEVPE